jgi:hypothetical protein
MRGTESALPTRGWVHTGIGMRTFTGWDGYMYELAYVHARIGICTSRNWDMYIYEIGWVHARIGICTCLNWHAYMYGLAHVQCWFCKMEYVGIKPRKG